MRTSGTPRRTALRIGIALAAVLVLVPATALAQDGGDIVLTDPDHPLNGAWRATHHAGTVVCSQVTIPIRAGDPATMRVTVHDGGARLEMTTPEGQVTMRRVTADEWDSEQDGDALILRRRVREDTNWLAWAAEGVGTVYEGSTSPTPEMTIRYVMGWFHDRPDEIHGHLTSAMAPDCRVLRGFELHRGG